MHVPYTVQKQHNTSVTQRHSLTYAFQMVQGQLEISTISQICLYMQGTPATIHTLTHWPQHDHLTGCVIAHMQSPTTFTLMCFPSLKEKFSAHFNNVITSCFKLFRIFMVGDSKMRKSLTVCTLNCVSH